MRKGGFIPIVINAVIFILLEAAALSMLSHNAPLQQTWFAKGGHAIRNALWGWSDGVAEYFSLRSRNDSLAMDNFRLRTKIAALESYIADSLVTSRIDGGENAGGYRYLPAEISKISNNTQHNYIIINKGEKDGVVCGSGLITGRGAIGVVDAVGGHISYVRSFKNHGMSVSARIGKTGASGPLTWDGIHSNIALLKEIPHHMEFSQGDTVYTSGFSSIFPPDIPLGITGASRIVNGSSYEIKVTLFEDFSALRYVTVVENLNKEDITSLEDKQ